MSKNLFITGTGTDIGKTFVSALIVKKLLNVIGVAVLNLFGQKTICEMDNKYIFKYKAA